MTVIWGSKANQQGVPPPVTVPDVMGKNVNDADRTLEHANLNMTFQGNAQGTAVSQSPTAGSTASYGDYVTVNFQ